jgi:hypothetical protein
LDKPGVSAYSGYKKICLFESDYCEKNLRYEGVREDLQDRTILFITLNLTLFFDSSPGFSQQFSLCARVRFKILCEWHFATIFCGRKAAPAGIFFQNEN